MKKKKAGLTLIEMIIVLVLTVIIISIMGTIFLTGNRVFSNTDVKSDLQIEGQTTQETLSKYAMQGAGIKEVELLNSDYTIDFESTEKSDIASKAAIMNEWTPIKKIVIYGVKRIPDPMDSMKEIVVRNEEGYTLILKDVDPADSSKGKELSMIDDGSSLGKVLSTNVDSFRIKPSDTGVEFEVILKKKKVFADEKKYPIIVDVLFRNKDISLDTSTS